MAMCARMRVTSSRQKWTALAGGAAIALVALVALVALAGCTSEPERDPTRIGGPGGGWGAGSSFSVGDPVPYRNDPLGGYKLPNEGRQDPLPGTRIDRLDSMDEFGQQN